MKLATNKFNDQDIQLMPSKTTEMGIGKEGIKMAIDMFTKQMYSNPIGSIVREIASNSVDSHVEAGITEPIKIKLLYEESGVYVSFKDFGVGMNPHRVETVYGRYFESTKRENNNEIGGFGVGGKSPMAYSDSFFITTVANKNDDVEHTTNVISTLNEGLSEIQRERELIGVDSDSSYMKHLIGLHGTEEEITKHIKFLTKRLKSVSAIKEKRVSYTYCIFKGENAPVIQEMIFHGTTDSKGTEVKIPIRKDDIRTFSFEIKRQLYYFNNVVFEGWGDDVVDNYTIYKGKSFVYRGSDYEGKTHVCLGDVAYPINYSNLPDVDNYTYNVPVAIILNIGDVDITPNRESLQYSEKTIKVITKKLEDVKEELVGMYTKQIENIVSLEDYLRFTNESRSLILGDDMVNISDFVPRNFKPKKFKYALLNIKNNNDLFKIAFNHHKIGISKGKGSYNLLSYTYLMNDNEDNNSGKKKIFYGGKYLTATNNYKKLYIKKKLNGCSQGHVVVTERELKIISNREINQIYSELGIIEYNQWDEVINAWNIEEKKAKRLFNALVKDIIKIGKKHLESYDFEAPLDFVNNIKASRRKKRINGDIKLAIRDYSNYEYACEVNLSALREFRGRVFYSLKEDEDIDSPLKKAKKAHISFFGNNNICTPYNNDGNGNLKIKKKSIMFIRIRKNQVHHLEKLKNAYHAKNYCKIMLSRKHDDFVNYLKKRNLNNFLTYLPSILNNPDIKKVDSEIGDAVEKINNEINLITTTITNNNFDSWYGLTEESLSNALKVREDDKECTNYKSKKEIQYIKNIQEKNKDVFEFINAGSNKPFTDKLVMLLDLALER